ncbi:MAG: DegT/DnrJ/EryC1/StrS family aminotransferase [Thermoplasmata archaeon]|nr:MAG: DegT/DnrJ/EryC1/StrS family aminotransferase [Thermoplasmata archaeon]
MISIAQPLFGDAEKKALIEVLESNILVQGPRVEKFETGFSDYIGTKHAIATSSGTTALAVSLMALGVKPGDEVITSPFTFIATASAILLCGAKPVFMDVDLQTFNIAPEFITEAITPKTRAIMPVHLYGLPAEMDAISAIAEEHKLVIVEDACQAHGAKYGDHKVGGIGDAGCFSFYPTKNMATGEGGMITTKEDTVAEKCKLIRNHGQQDRYYYVRWGCNYRMTEFAAALGNIQLTKLDEFNKKRQENAKRLSELLEGEVATPVIPANLTHVFHQYTIQLPSEKIRDGLKQHLFDNGIGSAVYYPLALHEIDFLEGRAVGSMENTKQLTQTVLSLPIHPALSSDDIDTIAGEVKAGLKKQG